MPIVWLFGLTIFTSAALLFALQPMFARMVLPLLGGTPAVWNTCMLFFQTVLLAGYAYAHFVARRLETSSQAVWHPLIVLLPLLLLPFGVPEGWSPPDDRTPVFWLLALMAVAVGAPFFVISATTPLLQKWFASTPHPSSHDPYFLYGASNMGSMLALLSYPVLIEPNLGLAAQSRWWAWGYGGLAMLMAGCAAVVWRQSQGAGRGSRVEGRKSEGRGSRVEGREPEGHVSDSSLPALDSRPSTLDSSALDSRLSTLDTGPLWRRRMLWVALAFVPSSWMLGLTTFLTTDIAPVPLLWIVPLSLYLLSFILVFSRRPLLRHHWMVRLFPWVAMLLAFSVLFQASWPILLLHVAAFFVGSMVCHGELAARRPAVSHLTEFYFWLSFGGMLGGVLNALAAPLLFDRPLEYPLTVLLACLLRREATFAPGDAAQASPLVSKARRKGRGSRVESRGPNAQTANAENHRPELILLGLFVAAAWLLRTYVGFQSSDLLFYLVIGAMPVLILSCLLDLPRLLAVGVGTLLIVNAFDQPFGEKILRSERSFYGVHRVVADSQQMHWLMHGMTAHGVQNRASGRRCVPLAYYHRGGPLGEVFSVFSGERAKRHVALVGLGSGAAVCYRREGQHFTFYEIDPVVKRLAETPEYFSYLSECAEGGYDVVLGDGRLKLAEADDGRYGLLVFDAFSSDAIPVHLLTREAFATYVAKLTGDGVLVFHVTNTHLNLEPVIADLAADAGLVCLIRHDLAVSNAEMKAGKLGSSWMIAARTRADLAELAHRPHWTPSRASEGGEVWRDDFSNVIGILNWFR